MADKRSGPTPFRPHTRDQERLEYLKELKANVSKIVKDALTPYLDQHFDRLVEEQKAELRKAISSPAP